MLAVVPVIVGSTPTLTAKINKMKNLVTLEIVKEDQLVFIEKVFKFNLVRQNNTSLHPDQVWGTNIKTKILGVGTGINKGKVWSYEGWEISDLIQAGLVKLHLA